MVNQQPEKSRAERELEPEHDTANLTADELRAISGGVFLNIEIDKRPNSDGRTHERGHHGKH
jgi:hypothetical protein